MTLKTASLAMIESENRIYMSNASTVSVCKPNSDEKKTVLFKSIYGNLALSKNGKYLASFFESQRLDVIDTSCDAHTILSKRWTRKNGMANCCFTDDNTLLIPVQNELWKISLSYQDINTRVYKCKRDNCLSDDWSDTGHILSVAYSQGNIYILHYSFEPSVTYLLVLDGESLKLINKTVVPREYNSMIYHKSKGICLFSMTDNTEILLCHPDTMKLSFTGIKLPSVMNPRLSYGGKYMTFQCSLSQTRSASCAFLVNTDDFSIADMKDTTVIYHPCFSLNHINCFF